MNTSNFHKALIDGPYTPNANFNIIGRFVGITRCGKFWFNGIHNWEWEIEFNFFHPLTWILILMSILINAFYFFYSNELSLSFHELKVVFLNKCPDKTHYYNKKNIKNSKNKLMAYL